MKNLNLYAILLVILFWDVPAAAQKNLISRGDRQAELKNYAGAIYLYENAYEKNPESRELIEKLATSYRLTNQYAKALDFYGLLMARATPERKTRYIMPICFCETATSAQRVKNWRSY